MGGLIRRIEPPRLIVVAMLDDLGKELAYGPLMPNFGQLRAEGLDLVNTYSMGLCVPSRATLLTGRYPCENGWSGHHEHWEYERSPTLVDSGFPLWTSRLNQGGWHVQVVGKWQMGDAARHGASVMLEKFGLENWLLWDGDYVGGDANRYYGQPLWSRDGPSTTDTFAERLFMQRIIAGLNVHAATGQRRTAIYYPLLLPHKPIIATPSDTRASLEHMVAGADRILGRLMTTIRALGLYSQTLILVTSDNGTDGAGKGELSERGVCVPTVAWGGYVRRRGVSEAMIDFTDFAPTICDVAGVEHAFPGHSFAGELTRGTGMARETAISMGVGRLRMQDGWLVGNDRTHARIAARNRYRLHRDGTLRLRKTGRIVENAGRARAKMEMALAVLPENRVLSVGG